MKKNSPKGPASETKGLAKSAVMEPKYRMRVEKDRTKFDKSKRLETKKALKKGLYFIWSIVWRLLNR